MTENSRQNLILQLTNNLEPVGPRGRVGLPAFLWLLSSWIYVLVVAISLGPFREAPLRALTENPHFALESAAGFAVTVLFGIMAFRESIPGLGNRWILPFAVAAAILWLGDHSAGLYWPALEPSMDGKRAHCVLEAFLYSGPPLLIGYLGLARRFPLRSVRAGVYLGISAGAIPALLMQFACMYSPAHILTHHLGPILVAITAGAIAGLILRRARFSPDRWKHAQ